MRINKHLFKRMRIQYLYGPSVHVLSKYHSMLVVLDA